MKVRVIGPERQLHQQQGPVYSHSCEDDCQQGNRPSQGMSRRRCSQDFPPLLPISSSFDSELHTPGFLLEHGKLPLNCSRYIKEWVCTTRSTERIEVPHLGSCGLSPITTDLICRWIGAEQLEVCLRDILSSGTVSRVVL